MVALDDLDALHAVMSDARAMRYWSTPPHGNLDQTFADAVEGDQKALIAAPADQSCGGERRTW